MLILVDTSCWIEYFRPTGDASIQAQIRTWLAADVVALCGPVRAEVLRGANKRDVKRIRSAFTALHYLETEDSEWATVEEVARRLSGQGNHVPLLDVLVAAIAARNDATVAHKDAHFKDLAVATSVRTHWFP